MHSNPFLKKFKVAYVQVIKRDVPGYRRYAPNEQEYFKAESALSTRLYLDIVAMQVVLDLGSAWRLFIWIAYSMRPKRKTIKLNELALMELFQCSSREVSRMKAKLITAEIIAQKQGNEYWINPTFLCSGDRVKLYPELSQYGKTVEEESYVPTPQYQSLME
jgi:hypothetical protein